MAVEYEISSDVATITGVASNTQVASIVKFYTGSITYDDEPTSKYASVTINGKTQRVMLCVAVSGTVNYDDVPCLYSTVDGHRTLNVVAPSESGTPDDVPSLYETIVVDGKTVRALRCVLINATPNYDGVSSTCTFTDNGKTHTAQLVNKIVGGSIEIIVKGVSPLSLPDAIANSLSYVKAYGGTEQRNLPDGYTELEYIESTGTQYIDTGVAPIPNVTSVELNVAIQDIDTTGQVFGSRTMASASSSSYNIIYSVSSGKKFRLDWVGTSYANTPPVTQGKYYNIKLEPDGGVYLDGTYYPKVTDKTECNYNMYLFALNTAGNVQPQGSMRIKGPVQIKNDGVLIRDMVPARRNSDGVLGMYDTVNDVFYTNSGTGTFAAGGEAVPSPDAPMDIVSNNGVLKYGFNYYSYNVTRQLSVENYPVELDRSVSYSNGVLTCSITGSVSSNRGLYPTWDMSFTAGHKYACVVMAKGDARINLGLTTIIPSGSVTGGSSSDGFYTLTSNYVWYAKRWECNTDSSARLNVRVVGTDVGQYASFKDILVIDLTAIFGAGNEPTTSSDIIQKTVEIYTDGTVETIEDTIGNTATAEMLLKVGDYQDVQSILDGVVTRKVGVKVLDGTENWIDTGGGYYLYIYAIQGGTGKTAYSTHFPCTNSYTQSRGAFNLGGSPLNNGNVIFNIGSTFATQSDWKDYLAEQYANGTPVIVVYPLATPTTESVAGQTLQVQAGDNTLEITQASLSGLELEAQYQAAVSLTIQEVQDANLDPNVEVTIN